jgi:hypothetical protein
MKRLVLGLFAVLMLLTTPAMAAERVTTLPEIKPVRSGRMDLALAINKDVLIHAKAEFIDDRLHAVAVDTKGNQVIEIVVIGNRIYLRQNTDTRWQATTVEIDDPGDVPVPGVPELPPFEELFTIYDLGTVEVRGVPTTQYQAQVDPAAIGAPNSTDFAFNLNVFIGIADAYLHKFQATILDTTFDEPALLETPLDVYDFNQPIVVGAPAPELVDEVGSLAVMERSDIPGAEVLPLWMRPLTEYSFKAKGYIR